MKEVRIAFTALLVLTLLAWVPQVQAQSTEISFWFPVGGGGNETLDWLADEVIPAFREENPDINVSLRFVGSGEDYSEQIRVAHVAGVAPDVFFTLGKGPDDFVAWGLTTPLDPWIRVWGQQGDYVPSAWETATIDGVQHAIPWSIHGRALWYHTKLFNEAGLEARIPQSWEEFATAAERLTRSTGDRIIQLGHDKVTYHEFFVWLHSAGGDLLTEDGTKAAINSRTSVDTLEYLVDLYNAQTRGLTPQGLSFNAGTIAMGGYPSSRLAEIHRQDPDLASQVAIDPVPRGVQNAIRVYVPALAIWSGSPNKDAAWKWIEFLQRPEYLAAYNSVERGRLSPRLSLLAPEYFEELPQYIALADIIVRYGIPHRYGPVDSTRLQIIIDAALKEVYNGERSPQAILDDVAHQWNIVIEAGL